MGKLVQKILASAARRVLKRFSPRIIAVTGSVGKTSVKDAVYVVLKDHFRVYRSEGGLNTEYGLPLTILRMAPPRAKWLWLFTCLLAWLKSWLMAGYAQILVLEYGADKPGDLAYLQLIAKPEIVVVTAVDVVHLAYYKDKQEIAAEKSTLLKNLSKFNLAILNFDDPLVKAMADQTRAQIVFYGAKAGAHFQAQSIKTSVRQTSFRLDKDKYRLPVFGSFHAQTALPAIIIGQFFNLDAKQIQSGLDQYTVPAGRLRVLPGRKQTTIIDSSYNASPAAMRAVLDEVLALPGQRVLVLGEMRELGTAEAAEHKKLVDYLLKNKSKWRQAILVGAAMKKYVLPMIKDAKYFASSRQAGKYLAKQIKGGEVILFKGSQNTIFLEEAIKEVLSPVVNSSDVLVRQSRFWLNKKERFFASL